jgi:hypothetical protein
MEVLGIRLEFRQGNVAADGVDQSKHGEEDGGKEEGWDLVHSQLKDGTSAGCMGGLEVLEVMSDVLENAGLAFGEDRDVMNETYV